MLKGFIFCSLLTGLLFVECHQCADAAPKAGAPGLAEKCRAWVRAHNFKIKSHTEWAGSMYRGCMSSKGQGY